MTPHINAKKEDIAKVVIMPGDPLRAKVMAEKFLKNVKLVSDVRNMLMFTGEYKNKKVTIAGSGMGMPSIGIYSYELFKFYEVDAIIRVGSAGSYKSDLKLYDIYNVKTSYTESTFLKYSANIDSNIIDSSSDLFELINSTANELNIALKSGIAHSSDVFYRIDDSIALAKKNNLDLVEMESAALFGNAKLLNKKAACLLTVSDNLITHEQTSTSERQTKFFKMVELALDAIIKI